MGTCFSEKKAVAFDHEDDTTITTNHSKDNLQMPQARSRIQTGSQWVNGPKTTFSSRNSSKYATKTIPSGPYVHSQQPLPNTQQHPHHAPPLNNINAANYPPKKRRGYEQVPDQSPPTSPEYLQSAIDNKAQSRTFPTRNTNNPYNKRSPYNKQKKKSSLPDRKSPQFKEPKWFNPSPTKRDPNALPRDANMNTNYHANQPKRGGNMKQKYHSNPVQQHKTSQPKVKPRPQPQKVAGFILPASIFNPGAAGAANNNSQQNQWNNSNKQRDNKQWNNSNDIKHNRAQNQRNHHKNDNKQWNNSNNMKHNSGNNMDYNRGQNQRNINKNNMKHNRGQNQRKQQKNGNKQWNNSNNMNYNRGQKQRNINKNNMNYNSGQNNKNHQKNNNKQWQSNNQRNNEWKNSNKQNANNESNQWQSVQTKPISHNNAPVQNKSQKPRTNAPQTATRYPSRPKPGGDAISRPPTRQQRQERRQQKVMKKQAPMKPKHAHKMTAAEEIFAINENDVDSDDTMEMRKKSVMEDFGKRKSYINYAADVSAPPQRGKKPTNWDEERRVSVFEESSSSDDSSDDGRRLTVDISHAKNRSVSSFVNLNPM